jgi:hypothetical protein
MLGCAAPPSDEPSALEAVGKGGATGHVDGGSGVESATSRADGAVPGAPPPALSCTSSCSAGATRCASPTKIQKCTMGSNGCRSFVTTTCATGTVCERTTPPACVDPQWAQWPISNAASEVAYGAPNLETLVDNLDRTVTDKVTGLMWEQDFHLSAYPDGDEFCATVRTGGYTDWRQPTIIELISIADFSRDRPSIDTTVFPLRSLAGFFWSNTQAYAYDLEPIIIDYGEFPAIEVAGGFGVDGQPGVNVRCVR